MWISCSSHVENPEDPQVFHMNLDAGLSTLDPAYARDQSSMWMSSQIFEGLVTLDDQLNIQPAIAKSWELDSSGTIYTFHIDTSIKFHESPLFDRNDQRKVNARDIEYSFSRICDPETASSGQWIFNGKIAGLEAFKENKADKISGFEAVNDSTFIIRLERPFPPFLSLLAMPYGFIVPQEVIESKGEDFSQQPIGTGPFRFYRWESGDFLILHKNPDYRYPELPKLAAIKVSFISSRLSAFIAFVQGELDMLNALDDSYKDEILYPNGKLKERYASQYNILTAPQLNTEYLGILVDKQLAAEHPLLSTQIRMAMNYAIDREKLVAYLLNGMGYPAEAGFIPQGMPGYSKEASPGYTYQPEKARKLLAEAGYPEGDGLPEITLYSTQKYATISEFIQKSFENIGLSLKVQNLQGGALRKEIYNSRINLWRASWIADYPDGENYMALFYSQNHSPSGPNTTHFSNSRLDELYQASLLESVDSLRHQIYHQMEKIMLSEAPIIPLYYDKSIRLVQPYIHGMSSNPMNHLNLTEVYIDEE